MINRLNVFQVKWLRQIFKMQTTFVNRGNTNAKVFEIIANQAMKEEKGKTLTQVISFDPTYLERRVVLSLVGAFAIPLRSAEHLAKNWCWGARFCVHHDGLGALDPRERRFGVRFLRVVFGSDAVGCFR